MIINKEFFKKRIAWWWTALVGLVIIVSLLIVRFISSGRLAKLGEIFVQLPGTVYFSLTPESQSVSLQSPFALTLNLDTGNESAVAADIVVGFDKDKLSLTNISENTANGFKTFAPIKDQTAIEFDKQRMIAEANQDGILEFGAVAIDMNNPQPSPQQFQGNTSLAILTFEIKSSAGVGETPIRLVYSPGALDDCNVVTFDAQNQPDDVLQAVESAVVNIGPSDACQHDYDGNHSLGVGDLLYILRNWDSTAVTKLLAILRNWGTSCG